MEDQKGKSNVMSASSSKQSVQGTESSLGSSGQEEKADDIFYERPYEYQRNYFDARSLVNLLDDYMEPKLNENILNVEEIKELGHGKI